MSEAQKNCKICQDYDKQDDPRCCIKKYVAILHTQLTDGTTHCFRKFESPGCLSPQWFYLNVIDSFSELIMVVEEEKWGGEWVKED